MAIKRHLKTFNICSYPPLYRADHIKYHESLNVKAQEITPGPNDKKSSTDFFHISLITPNYP